MAGPLPPHQAQSIPAGRFRETLGRFATGVTAVTAVDPRDGRPIGLAVNSFTSVSLEPPLALFCVARTSTSWPRMRAARCLCVNILGSGQRELCRRLAASGADKFRGVEWVESPGGAPLLAGALAWLECVVDAAHPAGDHVIVVVRVRQLAVAEDCAPLVFFGGQYGRFAAGPGSAENVYGTVAYTSAGE